MRGMVLGLLLLSASSAWADQVSFYQNSDGMELERFPVGTVDEAQELKNLNDNFAGCPCSKLRLPDAPLRNADGKRWKVQGNTVIEVVDNRPDAVARRQRLQAAKTKLQGLGLTPQDLQDALGQ